MSKTLIDIDADLLAGAQRVLGTGTKKATVNAALREVVRLHAAARFLERAEAGAFRAAPDAECRTELREAAT